MMSTPTRIRQDAQQQPTSSFTALNDANHSITPNTTPDRHVSSPNHQTNSPSAFGSLRARHGSLRSGAFLLRPAVSDAQTNGRASKGKSKVTSNGDLDALTTPENNKIRPVTPNNNEQSIYQDHESQSRPSDTFSAGDATTIVNMALELSEGRRRQASGGNMLLPNVTRAGRSMSGTAPTLNNTYASGVGSSLRRHFQDQRRMAKNSPSHSQRQSMIISPTPFYSQQPSNDSSTAGNPVKLSSSAMASIEKAKRYIELSTRYRELLTHLPPLSPNDTDQESSHLGRQYNPIQIIRNRKVRARSKIQMDPDSDVWENLEEVDSWISLVKQESSKKGFIQGDEALLPRFPLRPSVGRSANSNDPSLFSNLSNARPGKHRLDWLILPSELLADAYWTEHDQNKLDLEDSYGSHLFSSIRGANLRSERPSLDSQRSYQPSHLSLGSDRSIESDLEKKIARRGRRRTLLRDHDGTGKLRSVWQKARGRSKSADSGLSHSEDERGNRVKRTKTLEDIDYINPLPLEKYFRSIVESKPQSRRMSPSTASPGTPKHLALNGNGFDEKRIPSIENQIHGDGILTTPEGAWKTPEENRSIGQAISPYDARQSMDEPNSSSPMSGFGPRIIEPRSSIALVQAQFSKTKKMIPFRRSNSVRESRATEEGANDIVDHYNNERLVQLQTSPDIIGSTSSLKASEPTRYSSELTRVRTKNGKDKEPDSAVRRFFKGSLIGDLVRDGSRSTANVLRRRDASVEAPERANNRVADESDAEHTSGSVPDGRSSLKMKPKPKVASQKSTEDAQNKLPRRYHLELPSFRPLTPRGSAPSTPDQSPRGDRAKDYGFPLGITRSNISQILGISSKDSKKKQLLPAFTSNPYGDSAVTLTVPEIKSPGHDDLAHLDITSGKLPGQRQASIANIKGPIVPLKSTSDSITDTEVSTLETLLMCSGIKASELVRRLNIPCGSPPNCLVRAFEHSDVRIDAVSERQVYQKAADNLAETLTTESDRLYATTTHFRADTIAELRSSLGDLRNMAHDRLEQARQAGDIAVNFTAEVTGHKNIQIMQIVDGLEKFRRRRGRRLKWITRVAFGTLEWGVVLFMWAVWLVVLVIRIFLNILIGVVKFGKWALWIG
jgi:hypothetical protein